MNELTLEEVIDKIDDYLTETSIRDLELNKAVANNSVSASKDKLKQYKSELKDIEKRLKEIEKAALAATSKEKSLELWKTRNDLKDDIERIRGYIQQEENTLKTGKKDLSSAKKELRKADFDDFMQNNPISSRLRKFGEGLKSKKSAKEGALVPESAEDSEDNLLDNIVDLKIRVYEAYDEGYITEADKDLMLEYLNLDNYEEMQEDAQEENLQESFLDYISR